MDIFRSIVIIGVATMGFSASAGTPVAGADDAVVDCALEENAEQPTCLNLGSGFGGIAPVVLGGVVLLGAAAAASGGGSSGGTIGTD